MEKSKHFLSFEDKVKHENEAKKNIYDYFD